MARKRRTHRRRHLTRHGRPTAALIKRRRLQGFRYYKSGGARGRGRFVRVGKRPSKRSSMKFIRSQGFKSRRAYEAALQNIARVNEAFMNYRPKS